MDVKVVPYLDGHNVRAYRDEAGVFWAVAKDVCEALGLEQVTAAVNRLDEDERGVISDNPMLVDSLGRQQAFTVVNQSGLYNLIFRSDKPEAKKFRKWVTSVLLPSVLGSNPLAVDPAELPISKEEVAKLLRAGAERIEYLEFNVVHKRGALSTSQHVGVSYSRLSGKWAAYLNVNGEKKLFRWFDTEAEAVAARREAEEKYCGPSDHDLPTPD